MYSCEVAFKEYGSYFKGYGCCIGRHNMVPRHLNALGRTLYVYIYQVKKQRANFMYMVLCTSTKLMYTEEPIEPCVYINIAVTKELHDFFL